MHYPFGDRLARELLEHPLPGPLANGSDGCSVGWSPDVPQRLSEGLDRDVSPVMRALVIKVEQLRLVEVCRHHSCGLEQDGGGLVDEVSQPRPVGDDARQLHRHGLHNRTTPPFAVRREHKRVGHFEQLRIPLRGLVVHPHNWCVVCYSELFDRVLNKLVHNVLIARSYEELCLVSTFEFEQKRGNQRSEVFALFPLEHREEREVFVGSPHNFVQRLHCRRIKRHRIDGFGDHREFGGRDSRGHEAREAPPRGHPELVHHLNVLPPPPRDSSRLKHHPPYSVVKRTAAVSHEVGGVGSRVVLRHVDRRNAMGCGERAVGWQRLQRRPPRKAAAQCGGVCGDDVPDGPGSPKRIGVSKWHLGQIVVLRRPYQRQVGKRSQLEWHHEIDSLRRHTRPRVHRRIPQY
mmetsp:Transcript_7653/g.22618  ORF Transcript_7653/g.22618 Transcript_7653/m.22618 type:complete len:404 (-) Transcript_7653:76-1287(-)